MKVTKSRKPQGQSRWGEDTEAEKGGGQFVTNLQSDNMHLKLS